MPPYLTAPRAIYRPLQISPAPRLADPALRHPVFFTDTLVKAPTGVGAGNMSWRSPVALGYISEDGVRREATSRL